MFFPLMMRIKNGMDMVFLAVVKYLGKLIISEKGIISVNLYIWLLSFGWYSYAYLKIPRLLIEQIFSCF